MKINTDFVSAETAPALIEASQKPFLADNITLSVQCYENALICGLGESGVYVGAKRIFNTALHRMPNKDLPAPSPEKISEETVVFLGSWAPIWGHEITDNLKHLWFYFNSKYEYLKNFKFVYVSVFSTPPSDNFFELLENIGIPKNKLFWIQSPTQFQKVYVPDECFFHDLDLNCCRYTPEFLDLFSRLPQLPPPNINVEKVYFSHAQFPSWRDFNETDIENFFKNQGFTIIYPEKNTFLENLAILQHCTTFAATEGSISHNVIFCEKIETLLILRKMPSLNLYQFTANAILKIKNENLNIFYIDAATSSRLAKNRIFLYETNELRRFFNLPRRHFPFLKFIQFLFWYYDNNFLVKTHPLRAKLKLGTRLRQLFKKS